MTDLMDRTAAVRRRARLAAQEAVGGRSRSGGIPRTAGDRPRIDPRIAQRWVDARRQEGRRRLRFLLVVASMAGVAALAGGALFTPLFAVNHVRLTVNAAPGAGATVAAARIRVEAGLARHPLMIDLNPAAAARRLDADPLLGGARVTKHWPGTVTVTVALRSPLAQVPAGGAAAGAAARYVLVDATGRVLDRPSPQIPGVPVVQGTAPAPGLGAWIRGSAGSAASPTAPPAALVDMVAPSDGPTVPTGAAAALAFLQSIPANLRAAVQTVSAGPGPAISVVIAPPRVAEGTIWVDLGDGSQLAAKITAFDALLAQADLSGVASIDLSVPNRPAATLASGVGTASSSTGSSG